MTTAIIEQGREWFCRRSEELQQEVVVLETQLTELEQKNSLLPALLQMLGKYFGFGAAGKLDWARFKVKLKQEELDHFGTQYEVLKVTAQHSGTAPEPQRASSLGCAGETARQKMERMITENPAALEPHLRRVYQPLIETEEPVER